MYSTRALPCRGGPASASPSPVAERRGELDEHRRRRTSAGGERIDHVVVAPGRATGHLGLRAAAVDPFFGLDSTLVTETHLLDRCAEDAIDERAGEATEDD